VKRRPKSLVRRGPKSLWQWIRRMGLRKGYIAWSSARRSEKLIKIALDTPQGRAALAAAMQAPINQALRGTVGGSMPAEPEPEPRPEVEPLLDRLLALDPE
jgi:hypothetical protein